LDEEVLIALKKEKISYGQARVLLGVERQLQVEFLNKILDKNLSVREIEKMVKEYKTPSPYINKVKEYEKDKNCKITTTEKNITIKFKTKEELDNFLSKILDI
jgi:ParB family chromosome partitioning protein